MRKKKDKADQDINEFKIGDHVKINLHSGRIVDGTVKAIISRSHGSSLQVAFGSETALVHLWQVIEKIR
jgi:hypothetical protein